MMLLVLIACALRLCQGVKVVSRLSRWNHNDWDGEMTSNLWSPEVNKVITGMFSIDDNGYSDRKWWLYYGEVTEKDGTSLITCTPSGWTGYMNDMDGELDFSCGTNEALWGMNSYHDNGTEDRRWRFKCCDITTHGRFEIGAIRTTGYINDFDGDMDSKCGISEVMVGVYSYHDDRFEDRRWKLKCGSLIDVWQSPQEEWVHAELLPPATTGDVNGWDGFLEFETPLNYVLSGMKSEHDNSFDDRKYGFHYTTGRGMTCEPQTWSGWMNDWDGVLDIWCPDNSVISGLKSYHDNDKEDRKWAYKCCKLDGNKYKIGDRYINGWENDFDKAFDSTCGPSQVLVGLHSEHDDSFQDRRWKYICGVVLEKQSITRVLNLAQACMNGQCASQGECGWCGIGLCCKKGHSDLSGGCDGTFGGETQHECVAEPESRKISLQKSVVWSGTGKTVKLGAPYKITRVRVVNGQLDSQVMVDSTVCGVVTDTASTDLDCILAGSEVKADGGSSLSIEVFGSSLNSAQGACVFEDPTTSGGKITAPGTFSESECVNWCFTYSRYRTACQHDSWGQCVLYTASILGTSSDSYRKCWTFIDVDTYVAHKTPNLQASLNDWDDPLDFTATEGKVLTGIVGDNNDGHKDRRYGFYTATVGGVWDKQVQLATPQGWQTNWSEYDMEYVYQCPAQQALVGMKSEHSNGHGDRQWKARCGKFDEKVKLVEQRWTGWLNDWDKTLNGACGGYEVMVGAESMHDNGVEDRRWKISCAKVTDRFPHFDPVLLKSSTPTLTRSNWMSAVQDEKYLSELSLPGTHDSGSSEYHVPGYESYARNQDHEMKVQMEMGVRIFDIRVTHTSDRLHIVHGEVKMYKDALPGQPGAGYDFDDAFVLPAKNFLAANPQECLVAMMKQQKDPEDNTRSFADTWQMYIDMAPNMWLFVDKVPTLGDCRGKVWVMTSSGTKKFKSTVDEWRVTVQQNEWEVNDEKLEKINEDISDDFHNGRRRMSGFFTGDEKRRLDTTAGVSADVLAEGDVDIMDKMAQKALGQQFLNYKMKDALLDMEQDGVVLTANRDSGLSAEDAEALRIAVEQDFANTPQCNWSCYLNRYPDVGAASGRDETAAFNHYVKIGIHEGRRCTCDEECTFQITVTGHYYGNYGPFTHVDSCDATFSSPSEADSSSNGFTCGSRFGLQQSVLRSSTGKTVGTLSCANQGFDITIDSKSSVNGGRRRGEMGHGDENELVAPSGTELVAPNSNAVARRRLIPLVIIAIGAIVVAVGAATAGTFYINEALDTGKEAGVSVDFTEIDTRTGAGYKIWKILDHHTTKVENNLDLSKLSVQFFSFSDSTCWTAWPCTNTQTSQDIKAYRSLIPNLRGNQLGAILFDYPEQWQLDQVLCRNWGLLDGTFADGMCS